MSLKWIATGSGFQLFVQTNGDTAIYADATARDVYFAANPDDLALLDADEFLIIKLLDDGGGSVAYQQRQLGSWVDVTSLVQGESGPAGATGNSYFFDDVSVRDAFFNTGTNSTLLTKFLPVEVSKKSTTSIYSWRGDDNPASYDSTLFRRASTGTGPSSIILGVGDDVNDGLTLSSGARTVNFIDAYKATSIPLGTVYDTTGNKPSWEWTFGPSIDTASADVFDSTLADPQTMLFDDVGIDSITRAYSIRPATAGELRVRAFAGTAITDAPLIDMSVTIEVGDISTVVQVLLENNIVIQEGDDVLLEFSGIQLEGGLQTSGGFNGQTVPFLNADFATLVRHNLVKQDDPYQTFLDGSTQVTGATRSAFDWHVAAAKAGTAFSFTPWDNEPEASFLSPDETKLFMVGSENGLVYEFNVSPAGVISPSTVSFVQSFDPGITNIHGIDFHTNGKTMFLLDFPAKAVKSFLLDDEYSLTTVTPDKTRTLAPLGGGSLPHDLKFHPAGTAFFISEINNNNIEPYNMDPNDPWNIDTATLGATFATGITDNFATDFKDDGTIMAVIDGVGDITPFKLPTPWVPSTAEPGGPTFSAGLTDVRGFIYNRSGSKFYITSEGSDDIRQYHVGLDVSGPLNLRSPNTTSTAEINLFDSLGTNKLLIDYNETGNVNQITGSVSTTLSTTAATLHLTGATNVNLSANSGDINLSATGDVITFSDIRPFADGGPSLGTTGFRYANVSALKAGIGSATWLPDADLEVTGDILTGSLQSPFGGLGSRENLLQFSEEFDNAVWTDPQANTTTVPDNATAPNGTMTADTVTWDLVGLGKRQSSLATLDSTTYTLSIWGRNVSGNDTVRFDLHDGTSENIVFDSTMRRHTVTITSGTGGAFLDLTVQGSVGVFEFWGAQLALGTEPYPYSRTEEDLCQLEIGGTISGSLRAAGDATFTDGSSSKIFVDTASHQILITPDTDATGSYKLNDDSGALKGEFFYEDFNDTLGLAALTAFSVTSSTSLSLAAQTSLNITGTPVNINGEAAVTTTDTLSNNVIMRGNGSSSIDAIQSASGTIRTNTTGNALEIVSGGSGTVTYALQDDSSVERVRLQFNIDAVTSNLTAIQAFAVNITGDLDLNPSTRVRTSSNLEVGGDKIIHPFEDGITASTTQTQGEQPLTKDFNFVTTVANGDDVVTMPTAEAGREVRIANSGANALQVFPATGDNFQSFSVNTSITVAQDGTAIFFATGATEWSLLSS